MVHEVWLEGQEIQALTNCIQKQIMPSWWPLAEIVLHRVPSVMSEPGLFKFLGWNPVSGFWSCDVDKADKLMYSAVGSTYFTCAGFGLPFLPPAQEMLLYPAASKAIKHFEGSYPYKVQRESWQIKRLNSQESDTHSDLACWSEWLERWRFVNVLKSLKGTVKWKP